MYRFIFSNLFVIAFCFWAGGSIAQELPVKEVRHYDYCADIIGSSNQLYRMVIACNSGRIATWKDILVTDTRPSTAITLNPSGSHFAVATDKYVIEIWSLEKRKVEYGKLRGHSGTVRTMDYSRDSRYLLSAGDDKTLKIWETKGLTLFRNLPCLMPVRAACFSPNGYFVACDQGNDIVVFNFSKNKAVIGFSGHTSPIVKVKFSDDGNYLMSLDESGYIIIWSVVTGDIYRRMKVPGEVKNADIHHNNKYLATLDKSGKLSVWNLKSEELVQDLKSQQEGVNLHFAYDYDKETALLTHCDRLNCYIWDISRLEPAFDMLAAKMHEERMNQWNRKRSDETSETYERRVNDSLQQKNVLVMRDVVTELGLKWRPLGKPQRSEYMERFGGYVLTFPKVKPFVLRIYNENREEFERNFEQFQYAKPVYALDDRDIFSLDYLEVCDSLKKHVYYFDNIQLHTEPQQQLVSKDIVRKVGEEEVVLRRKLKDFFAKEMAEQRISDNIQVNVEARPRESIGEDGEPVVDYHIDYSYEVMKTAKKDVGDWAPGRYLLSESNAAAASVQVIKETFGNELAQYIVPGKNITVKITGSADGSPIVNTIKYAEGFGLFDEEPYYLNGNMDNISVSAKSGISSNSQLAFLRTYGVRHFIEQEIPGLKQTNNIFEHHVFVSEERGNEFRRVSIEIIIHDAFGR